ncbi:MAG: hypothetical protein Q8R47_05595 [Nanoarchaeota archaeon]|nr:hypothetical protein [Nanoarchaeota archaeon]
MKQGFKLLSVLLLTVLLAVSATAQINWMKQDGGHNYLAWQDGSKSYYVNYGQDASFATGYFGSTASKTVKLTVTLNSVSTGKIASTIFSGNVDVSKTLAYKTFAITSKDYQNKAGQYIVVIKVKDANTEYVDTSLFLQVFPEISIFIPPITAVIPINPVGKDTPPEINTINYDNDILETDTLHFTISTNDKEKDKLKFAIEECTASIGGFCFKWGSVQEASLSFNENSGAFSWIPGYEYVQHVQHPSLTKRALFRFKAIEVNDNTKTSNWAFVNVNVHDVNRIPVFDFIEPKHIKQGEDTAFTVNAIDADKDALKYSIFSTNLPAQSYAFDKDTQKFTFTHGFTSDGVYTTVFQVDDDFGGQDFATAYIVITPAPENNKTQCDDGKDNDVDHKTDFPDDPGCKDKNDNDESDDKPAETQCNDNEDNDKDGAVDAHDPGCHTDGNPENMHSYDPNDNDESNDNPVKKPQCDDEKDNDADHKTDFPDDPGCKDKDDDDESDDKPAETQCNDNKDNDRDGLIDYGNDPRVNDPGCKDKNDNDETDEPVTQCNDGKDNDNDKLTDMNDPGCHTDGDAGDVDTYNPRDNDESNLMPPQKEPKEPIDIDLLSAHVVDEIEAGKTLFVDVRVHNDGKKEVKNLQVQAKIYDLGVWGSTGKFTLKAGKSANRNIYVALPEDAAPGWYLIKITATNGQSHTSTYRLVYIDSNTF